MRWGIFLAAAVITVLPKYAFADAGFDRPIWASGVSSVLIENPVPDHIEGEQHPLLIGLRSCNSYVAIQTMGILSEVAENPLAYDEYTRATAIIVAQRYRIHESVEDLIAILDRHTESIEVRENNLTQYRSMLLIALAHCRDQRTEEVLKRGLADTGEGDAIRQICAMGLVAINSDAGRDFLMARIRAGLLLGHTAGRNTMKSVRCLADVKLEADTQELRFKITGTSAANQLDELLAAMRFKVAPLEEVFVVLKEGRSTEEALRVLGERGDADTIAALEQFAVKLPLDEELIAGVRVAIVNIKYREWRKGL